MYQRIARTGYPPTPTRKICLTQSAAPAIICYPHPIGVTMKTGKYTQSELDFIKLHLADDPEKVAKVLDRSPASVKAAITRIKTSGPDPRQQELPLDDAPPTPEDAPPIPEDAPTMRLKISELLNRLPPTPTRKICLPQSAAPAILCTLVCTTDRRPSKLSFRGGSLCPDYRKRGFK